MTKSHGVRILLIDQSTPITKRLATLLKDNGFQVHMADDGREAPSKILEVRPHFILCDIAMPDFSAVECLDFLKEKNLSVQNQTRLIVLSAHNDRRNVDDCLKRGAADFLVKPLNPAEVVKRLALQMQANHQLSRVEEMPGDASQLANYYLNLVELLMKTAALKTSDHQINYQLLRMLAMATKAVRISLIQSEPVPTVVASSDNASFSHFSLDIEKYPEIEYVQRTGKPLFIESVNDSEQMSFIQDQLQSVQFNTMIVLPVINDGAIQGVLSTKLATSAHLTDADIRLCQIVAQIFCHRGLAAGRAPSRAS